MGIPQGSPVSPILSCLYSASVLRDLTLNPLFSSRGIPVGPRSYIDDIGFLAISDSFGENVILLRETLYRTVDALERIGMRIDPDKSDLMHFSWKRGNSSSPSLTAQLYNQSVTITPPKSIQWLGFYFDRKLTFREHVNILTKRADNVANGLRCLGNTIHGISPANLRLLFKTCVIPVMTYGCPLWFRSDSPRKGHMKKLQVVQNKVLRHIAGAFCTTPSPILHLLTFCPPIEVLVRKLVQSASLRFFRLPLSSEISQRLPINYL